MTVKLLPDDFCEAARRLGSNSVTVLIEGREALLATGLTEEFLDALGVESVRVYASWGGGRRHRDAKLFSLGECMGSSHGVGFDERADTDAMAAALSGTLRFVKRHGRLGCWSVEVLEAAIRMLGAGPDVEP